jgi:Raffinose synthase or seed imbibition protein Sip1
MMQKLWRHQCTHASACALSCVQLKCGRFLACARNKLWWMTPEWGTSAKQLPPEVQFLLVEHDKEEGLYFILLPLIDNNTFRATLRPGRCGHGMVT